MRLPVTFVLLICLLLFACKVEIEKPIEANPLQGVWELIHADWNLNDSIEAQEIESLKYYSEKHFFVIGNVDNVYSLAGTYSCKGDTCIEIVGLNSFDMYGEEIEIIFSVKNDTLSLDSEWYTEKWKRLE